MIDYDVSSEQSGQGCSENSLLKAQEIPAYVGVIIDSSSVSVT